MAIHHRPGRFELSQDGQVCVLDYERDGGRVVFTHTGVPPALRGQGLAAQLVDAALQWATRENLEVIPACSYVVRHLARRETDLGDA